MQTLIWSRGKDRDCCLPSVLRATLPLCLLLASGSAHADGGAQRLLGSFLSAGGYFPTDAGGRRVLGDTKFYSDTAFFVRPAHRGRFLITGGGQIVTASDHFLPFQGGNDYSLIGPAGRVTTARVLGQPRPFLEGGLYVGRLRSIQAGFDRSTFTPSVQAGVEYPFARYFTLSAGYRVSQQIHGVNTDGFSVSLKVF